MVDFGHNYMHAMDKPELEQVKISTKDIGISMGIGDPWSNVKAAVSAGAGTVELGFFGMGKGSINSPTGVSPETIGKTKREDIRAFAKLNDIKLSTHAAAPITGVTGLSRDGRSFSDTAAQNTIIEIQRAIDFAADTAEGGAVVFHVGEFPRDVTKFKEFQPKHGEWQKEEVASLVNGETGQLIQFQKGQVILEPKWEKNKMGEFLDKDGKVITDVEKNPWKKIPTYNAEGSVKFEEKRWKDIEKEVNLWNNNNPKSQEKNAAKEFFIATQRADIDRAAPFVYSHMRQYEDAHKQLKEAKRIQRDVEELQNKVPKEKWHMIKNNIQQELRQEVPENLTPAEFMDQQVKRLELYAQREKEGFIGYSQQLEQMKKMQREIVPIEEYGVKRSAEKMAEVAMHAYEVTKKRGLKKEIFIAPENLFPETGFGSHPQELKKIIQDSRKEFAKLLERKKGLSPNEAKKAAENHIKATFDIAHANTWRKFFNKSDEEFEKWLEHQVEDLTKSNIIGHAHISDNFGYYDEHLGPGEGNSPIEMFIDKLKKSGTFKGHMIVEPGAQGEGETIFATMMGGWAKIANSPMYRVGPVSRSWTDISGSYFGQTHTPRHIAGGYIINPQSEDNWWSGTPIE